MGSFLEIEKKASRRSPDFVGGQVHPSGSGGNGKNLDRSGQEDFYRCAQCGMYCLASRVQSPGGGNDGNGNLVWTGSDVLSQSGGCPDCGSLNSKGSNSNG